MKRSRDCAQKSSTSSGSIPGFYYDPIKERYFPAALLGSKSMSIPPPATVMPSNKAPMVVASHWMYDREVRPYRGCKFDVAIRLISCRMKLRRLSLSLSEDTSDEFEDVCHAPGWGDFLVQRENLFVFWNEGGYSQLSLTRLSLIPLGFGGVQLVWAFNDISSMHMIVLSSNGSDSEISLIQFTRSNDLTGYHLIPSFPAQSAASASFPESTSGFSMDCRLKLLWRQRISRFTVFDAIVAANNGSPCLKCSGEREAVMCDLLSGRVTRMKPARKIVSPVTSMCAISVLNGCSTIIEGLRNGKITLSDSRAPSTEGGGSSSVCSMPHCIDYMQVLDTDASGGLLVVQDCTAMMKVFDIRFGSRELLVVSSGDGLVRSKRRFWVSPDNRMVTAVSSQSGLVNLFSLMKSNEKLSTLEYLDNSERSGSGSGLSSWGARPAAFGAAASAAAAAGSAGGAGAVYRAPWTRFSRSCQDRSNTTSTTELPYNDMLGISFNSIRSGSCTMFKSEL